MKFGKNVQYLRQMSLLTLGGQHQSSRSKCRSALCLLDLTATFDTIEDQLLLHCFERWFARCCPDLVFVVFDQQIISDLAQW